MLERLRSLRAAITVADDELRAARAVLAAERASLQAAQDDSPADEIEAQVRLSLIADYQSTVDVYDALVADLERDSTAARESHQTYRDECNAKKCCAIREADGSLSHIGTDYLSCLARLESAPGAELIDTTPVGLIALEAEAVAEKALVARKVQLESLVNAAEDLAAVEAELAERRRA